MEKVNEGTTSYLTVTFKDKAGVAQTPASATWEVIDLLSGTVKLSPTAITPAGTVELTVPASVNSIVDDANPEEVRRVIVKATYAADDKVNSQYDYAVVNLSKVP